MKYILEIENLEKRYGKFKVINKLDMQKRFNIWTYWKKRSG